MFVCHNRSQSLKVKRRTRADKIAIWQANLKISTKIHQRVAVISINDLYNTASGGDQVIRQQIGARVDIESSNGQGFTQIEKIKERIKQISTGSSHTVDNCFSIKCQQIRPNTI